ncbi:MAG: flagellar filament capping protein FliD [Verrucomicrobia bacterium]|nr:flagellar filament capping protein FliD [Verrucomicrobiota bacterium]
MYQVTNSSDIQSIVSQLMALEAKPLTQLQTKRTTYENQIDAWEEIRTSLRTLQTSLDALTRSVTFLSRTATSSDSDVITANAGTSASETTYTFSNITLATAANVQSSGAIGLSAGTYTTLVSGEEINTAGGDADFNVRIDSGSLNLDAGKSIVAGTFFVNSKEITVTESDTIMTILGKINASGAGVSASISGDKVTIAQKTVGPNWFVNLEEDTTGFFDAMKLTSGNGNPEPSLTWGDYAGYDQDLEDTGLGFADGYFTINGITFTVDASEDSLSDIVNDINSSAAGVFAFYDSVSDSLSLISSVDDQDIVLSNDTASLFSRLSIATGTHEGTGATFTLNGQVLSRDSNTFTINGTEFTLRGGGTATVTVARDTETATSKIQAFVTQYNKTVELLYSKETDSASPLKGDQRLKSLSRRLRAFIYSSVDNPGSLAYLSEIGLDINHESKAKTISIDADDLDDALAADPNAVFQLFAFNTDLDGLYDDGGLANVLNDYVEEYTKAYSGYIVERKESIEDRIDTLDKKISRKQEQLARREKQLTLEYERIFSQFQQLQSQSTGVTLALMSMASGNSSGASSLLG